MSELLLVPSSYYFSRYGIDVFCKSKIGNSLADSEAFKIFRGATGAWQMHLRAAASLVPHIGLKDEKTLTSEEHTTITVLIGSFIWFDVLAGASTSSRHFLGLDHLQLLEGNMIHLEELVGCENWVVALIFRISVLGNWKRESESNRRLSISELAKRGAEIEACLQNNLSKISHQSTVREESLSGVTSPFSGSARAVITKIFALSALTYLHVVVSGPIFELPEITDSVTKTVAEFVNLRDARLLQYFSLAVLCCRMFGIG